jgi:apolipoprotein N-acyltransferase
VAARLAADGFPWLAFGYAQTPPSPLAGYAPLLGVYGVGFVAALIAVSWRD